ERVTATFDLTLSLHETAAGVRGTLEYRTDLFDDVTILRLATHFTTLLAGMVRDPHARLSDLPLLSRAENHQLTREWNATRSAYPRERSIPELFELWAERTPDTPAVVFEDRVLSYRELNRRANRLAHHLRALGVGDPSSRPVSRFDGPSSDNGSRSAPIKRLPPTAASENPLIGIAVERSAEMVVDLLAILKAGGAYLPLDPTYPEQRLALMLEDARSPVLLVREGVGERLDGLARRLAERVCPDRDREAISRQSPENPRCCVRGDDLAYVLYTSGSTGRPKGVAVTHRSVVRLVRETNYAELSSREVFLQLAPVAFDASTLEIWGPLVNGGRLVIFPEARSSLEELANAIARHRISTLWLTAGLFHQMADRHPRGLRPVRQLLAGGDVLSAPRVRKVLEEVAGLTLINGYGPTENTTFTCCQSFRSPSEVPAAVAIGRPIANTRVWLLDRRLRPVPVGVVGELCTGGDGLARCYFDRPQQTAEAFIPHPLGERGGERVYRTGDLARYLADGRIEFLGRIDHQVKLRGFRIELGEIESVLSRHRGVRETAVVLREDVAGDPRLVAYAVPDREAVPATESLWELLKTTLPEFMVPSALVFLETLPLTPNGKVDRRALPPPGPRQAPEKDLVAPADPTGELLAGIWQEVLGVERVGMHDDFFELGGHSLAATQVASRVREIFAVEVPLAKLFAAPTLTELASIVDDAQLGTRGLEAPPMVAVARDQGPDRRGVPLSFAQQRLWYLHQLEPDTPVYNLPAAVRVSGALTSGLLERIFNEVVRRHESLRTTFTAAGEQPLQLIAERLHLPLPVADLEPLPAGAREAEAHRLADEEARRLFDLSSGPLVRFTLLRLADEDHVLLVTMHHIVSDGWSMGIFLRELSVLFEAFSRGNPSPLAGLGLQYADFACWQRQWLAGEVLEAEMAYWRGELTGAPRHSELPCDRPRPAVRTYRGRSQGIALSEELSAALVDRSRSQGVTLFMTLLAAFATLLGRHAGQQDVVVGSPIAGRNRREIEGLIGFFVNTLVLRTALAGNPSFEQLLVRVQRTAVDAYAHQNLPFEQLVEELRPPRDPSLHPLFQVMFALQNAPQGSFESSALTLAPLEVAGAVARFDLTVSLQESAAGLTGVLEYTTDLFDAVTIDRLALHYRNLLASVAADPDQRLSDLPLLSSAEHHQLTREWNDTPSNYPRERAVHELVELWAERTPDAPALVFEDRYLSYRELNRRANQLAHHLRALGVGAPASRPDSLIGVTVERSAEMVVDLLAILKAGGAYLPLDPTYPTERLAFMLEDARSQVVLVRPEARERLDGIARRLATGSSLAFQRVCPDADGEAISRQSPENPRCCVRGDDLAYVLYTSGSTGRPKGVAVAHRSVVRLVRETNFAELSSREVFLQFVPVAFDVSTFEIWGPLANGGRLVIFPEAR
ncbi:MAG: amino acid adenylation domain-containing protein, partial [bacterium]|nr:amino acid adenylation domain-containing protein [bacterium]